MGKPGYVCDRRDHTCNHGTVLWVAFGTEGPCHVCPYSIQSPAAALCIHCESALKQKLDERRALRTLALETWAWTLLSPASLQGNADFTGLPLQSPSVT